jgi:hypothetical protein
MFRRFAAVLAAAIIPAAALALAIPAAHAAIPATVIALPALGTSGANPLGQAMNAKNWAGIGNSSTCSTGNGVVNTPIGTWSVNSAHCASDFQILVDPAPGTFQIQYNPSGNTSANLCVSTINNVQGTFSRLRPCAAGGNIWQTFETLPATTDITGGREIVPVAAPSLALNAFGYKTNAASQVGLWHITTGANQIWASVAGPGLPA